MSLAWVRWAVRQVRPKGLGRRRGLVALLFLTLMVTGLSLAGVEPDAAAARPRVKPPRPQYIPAVPHRVLNPKPSKGSPNSSPTSATDLDIELPAYAKATVTAKSDHQPVRASGTPVLVGRPSDAKSQRRAAEDATFDVTIKGAAATARAGVDGVLFTVKPIAVKPNEEASGEISVGLDYSEFADVGGASYGSRLKLVGLPSCVLTTPARPECRATTEVDSVNDPVGEVVTARVSDATVAEGGEMVFATLTTADAETGSFKATSLSPADSWSHSGASGSFSWSYPVPVTPAPGEATPSVALSYNSARMDGLNSESNNQPSWVGEGWDYNPGYIERSYRTCSVDRTLPKDWQTGELCWAGQVITLNLGGKTTRIVYDDASGTWHAADDDAERVQFVRDPGNELGENGAPGGERWVITSADGVKYHFGRGKLPTSPFPTSTESVWTVPVVGGHPGDPCHDATAGAPAKDSRCLQVWRWNLDYVEDPHRNAAAYHYKSEFNRYNTAKFEGENDLVGYTRGGYLDWIDYGLRAAADGTLSSVAPRRVEFDVTERCLLEDPACDPDKFDTDPHLWADTPHDLACTTGQSAECHNRAPTFWTRKRLEVIRTQHHAGPAGYTDIDSVKLTHEFPNDGPDALTLKAITRTGHSADGTKITLPSVTFSGDLKPNRVPVGGGPEMYFRRLNSIATETGQLITVGYSGEVGQEGRAPAPCTTAVASVDPADNTTMCYPVMVDSTDETQPPPTKEYFRKYVVTQVSVKDQFNTTPERLSTYTYLGTPAWHFDDNEVSPARLRTWAQFRGFRTVETRTGNPDYKTNSVLDKRTLTKTTYLRGMGGTVTDSTGAEHDNPNHFADRVLETQTFAGDTAERLTSSITSWHTVRKTATHNRDGLSDLTANIVRATQTRSFIQTAAGATKNATTTKSYDDLGRLLSTAETGDGVLARCTKTEYASDDENPPAHWVLSRPAETRTVKGLCSASPEGETLALKQFFYDNQNTAGVVIDRGRLTKVRTATTNATSFAVSTFDHDVHGRVTSSTTYADNGDTETGRTTTTSYEPTQGGPVVKMTTLNPKGQRTTILLDPGREIPVHMTDIAGLDTDATLDPLGRVTAVWQPGQTKGVDPASVTYGYRVSLAEAPTLALTTKTLVDNGQTTGYRTSVDLFDSSGALRQTQVEAIGGGRVVTDAFADSHGWVAATYNRWLTSGDPAASLIAPLSTSAVLSRTVKRYDGAGRETLSTEFHGDTEKWSTKTYHGGDRTTVVPPTGGTTTTDIVDVRGQVTQRLNWSTPPTITGNVVSGPATSYRATTYGYDAAGNQASITSPTGTTWTTTYDLAGRPVETNDPDMGTTTLAYNDIGETVSSSDARSTIKYQYDKLGRKTAELTGSTPLAEWHYDTWEPSAGENPISSPGALLATTSHQDGKTYTVNTTGFDAVGRPLGSEVRLSEPGFKTSYKTTNTWTTTGLVKTDTLADSKSPAGDGVYSETIRRGYDTFGNPTTSMGTFGYVTETQYSPFHEPNIYTLGANDETAWLSYSREAGTGRTTHVKMSATTSPAQIELVKYEYNAFGNITKTINTQGGGTAPPVETQCFRYNTLSQLTAAWSATDGCAKTPTTTDKTMIGGPQKFWTTWTFDTAGQRTKQTQYAVPGSTAPTKVTDYTYATTGHKHALSSAKTTNTTSSGTTTTSSLSYGYDDTGNMISRGASTGAQTLAYDHHNRTQTITASGVNVSYVYDADGNQLLRRDGTTATLFLPGQEIAYDTATNKTTVTKYYSHNGTVVAVRKNSGNPTYLMSDQHGSNQVALGSVGWAVSRRYLDPYGSPLTPTVGTWPDKHGFLDKPQSPTTGLVDMGARKYDPSTGRFLSVDPLLDPADHLSLNGYTYADQNPINNSDPTGLYCADRCGGGVESSGPEPTPEETEQENLEEAQQINADFQAGDHPDELMTVNGETVRAGDVVGAYFDSHPEFADNTAETALKAAALDPDECDDKTSFSCGFEVVTILPWFKALRVVRVVDDLRDADRAADSAKTADNAADSCRAGDNSFTGDTFVLMADGSKKPIKDVKLGDQVTATDPITGERGPRKVVDLIRHGGWHTMVAVRLADGSTINATDRHPFWAVSRADWVDAIDLRSGDVVIGAAGDRITVAGARISEQDLTAYNLSIAGLHTYHVGADHVLVHNCTGTPRRRTTPEKPSDPPSWVKQEGHYAETADANPAAAARRIMDEHYPNGWSGKGAGSELSQLQKWLSRYYKWR